MTLEKFFSGLPDKDPPSEPTLEDVIAKHESGIKKEAIRRRVGVPHPGAPVPNEVRKNTDRMLGERED